MQDQALEYAQAHHEEYLAQLFDLLRIPSISTLSENKPDMQKTAEWLAADMTRAGLKNVAVMPTGGNPVVYGEWLEAGEDKPTVLIYGHYDVQPVDPLDLWHSPPFEPEIRDGKIYARGATDDKGQLFVHVKAIEAVLATSGKLPINVKVIFEGEEEIGSASLEPFIEVNRDLLAADMVLVSDTSFLTHTQPLILYGLRGIASAEISVTGPKRDLHSGAYGGTVHNPALALVEILSKLHETPGVVAIPGFYDNVRTLDDAEREMLASVPFTLEQWQQETGLETPWGDEDYTLLERHGVRPTCEINGIFGGFQGEGGKTIIPASAGAKISMRLVPNQDPELIAALFKEYVMSIAPDDVTVEVAVTEGGWWVLSPVDSPEINAMARTYEQVWGEKPIAMPGGGSIPILAVMQKELGTSIVMLGFGVPDSNGHAPNESFPVVQFTKGIEAAIRYYYALVEG